MPLLRRPSPPRAWHWLALTLALGLHGAALAATQPPLPLASLPATHTLSAASLSLAADREGWNDRREALASALAQLQPDVIALQDVLQTPELPNQACWLAARLGYSCDFITADPPSRPRREGNALLTRRPLVEDAVTLLHPFEMRDTAGMVRLDLDGAALNVYCLQLHADDGEGAQDAAAIRRAQLENLLRWIDATAGDAPSIVLGDFASGIDAPELAPLLAANYRPARSGVTGALARERLFVPQGRLRIDTVQPLLPASGGGAPRGLLARISLLPAALLRQP